MFSIICYHSLSFYGTKSYSVLAQGGSIAQWLAYLLTDSPASGLTPNGPETCSDEKIVDVAEVNQWHCLEECEQRLETVAQTHLVLASGTLVLQTSISARKFHDLFLQIRLHFSGLE